MIPLRYATASQRIPVGYFVDSLDGDSAETALTISNADIKLHKANAEDLVNKNSGGATEMGFTGIYFITLDATDTNTLGPLVIFVHETGALPVRVECCVLAQQVYDSLFAGDQLNVDVTHFGGAAGTFAGGKPEVTTSAASNSLIKDSITCVMTGTVYTAAGTSLESSDLVLALGNLEGLTCVVYDADGGGLASYRRINTIAEDAITVESPFDFTPEAGDTFAILRGTFTPPHFSALGINASGHVSRVTLVDTATALTEDVGAGSNVGPGADQVTISITDDEDNPVADADVWISTDSNGSTVVAGTRQTNDAGEVLFMLDDGITYYLWMRKNGVESIDGQVFVAEAD